MCLIREVWRDIEGYEGLYQVSNYGRVKSIERVVIYNDGRKKLIPERIMKQIECEGYLCVVLSKNNKSKHLKIHRLLALTYLENPNNYPIINHITENKDFNFIGIVNNEIISSSIEWCTHLQNMNFGSLKERASKNSKGKNNPMYGKHHSKKTKEKLSVMFKGKPNYNKRKPILQYTLDGVLVKEWSSGREIYQTIGFSQGNISSCCSGALKSAYGFIWKYK